MSATGDFGYNPNMNAPVSSGRNPLAVWLLLALLAAGVFAALLLRPVPSRNAFENRAVGRRPKLIWLRTLAESGQTIDNGQLVGKVALINFWGPWCDICVKEFPQMLELERQFRSNTDFRFLAVSCGEGRDGPEEVPELERSTQEFLRKMRTELPAYFDPDAFTRQALHEIGAFDDGYPTTIILDRQGMIRGVWQGFMAGDHEQMRALVEQLLRRRATRKQFKQADRGSDVE